MMEDMEVGLFRMADSAANSALFLIHYFSCLISHALLLMEDIDVGLKNLEASFYDVEKCYLIKFGNAQKPEAAW